MLCDWVSNYLKPSKNQTKCTLNPNFSAVFESWPRRSLVVTMKKVDIPSCIAVSTFFLLRIVTLISVSPIFPILADIPKKSQSAEEGAPAPDNRPHLHLQAATVAALVSPEYGSLVFRVPAADVDFKPKEKTCECMG